MTEIKSILSNLQQPRENNRPFNSYIAEQANVCTVEEYVDKVVEQQGLSPEELTKEKVMSFFPEGTKFLKKVYIGNPQNRKPMLHNNCEIFTQFHITDEYNVFLERVLFQAGFAQSQDIRVEAPVDFSKLTGKKK